MQVKDGKHTYQGRELPRQDEEVVDQGLGFDLQTLVNRRSILSAVGLGAAAFGLAACSPNSSSAGSSGSGSATGSASASATAAGTIDVDSEIPDETAGPYPGDGSNGADVLEQSGVVRSDIRSSFNGASGTAEGIPMTLELTIADMANGNKPFTGAAVYVWHCNRDGEYSMYSENIVDENYLRGVQIVDQQGKVTFTSIFPACYSGRWPHIHFEVYPDEASITDSANAISTSQVALPQDVCDTVYATTGYEQSVTNLAGISLSADNVFGEDEGASQMATVTGNASSGYKVSLTAGVDTGTEPTGGSMPADGGGGPGGGGAPMGAPGA
ncbi:intradiol ring-cleavage dioxygenase [Kocuria coralli]|uniref:Intradiol ring-cleavage dioxygenase n=1 Tax=Kocuria coralli TaxID=1461025 RepID=A0A5J5KT99_9MICC|nr:intradiol ring-cleavage dioxygenase [Kocuria coralli]KAA9392997.1 intradiol ring-cleavage dioxygenase [Kocuria coralli]